MGNLQIILVYNLIKYLFSSDKCDQLCFVTDKSNSLHSYQKCHLLMSEWYRIYKVYNLQHTRVNSVNH